MELFFNYSDFIGTCFVVILTLLILYLTWRDRQKALSLRELQKQSATLHKTFLELIKPNLVVEGFDYQSALIYKFYIKNSGGNCYNLKYHHEMEFPPCTIKLPKTESFASNSSYQCTLIFRDKQDFNKDLETVFTYNDFEHRNYSQKLILERPSLGILARFYFKAPVLLTEQPKP